MSEPSCIQQEESSIEKIQEQRVISEHKSDSATLLVYTFLLILSVLTIWLFKHRRLRFVHSTGLSIIYGLIVGAVIRYASQPASRSVTHLALPAPKNASSCDTQLPPDRIVLHVQLKEDDALRINTTMAYEYKFMQRVKEDMPKDVKIDEISNISTTQMHVLSQIVPKFTFNPEIFFNLLLPPIIFTAGYSMKRKYFFQNFGAIIAYAFIGTILSSSVIGGICYGFTRLFPSLSKILNFSDCLFFGAIISATDPVTVLTIFSDLNVDVDLYALVFGESVLNDAVAIVLSDSIEKYSSVTKGDLDFSAILECIGTFMGVFWGAFAIGVVMGIVTAFLTKYTYIRDHPILETALFVLMSYSTFLAAEAAGLTGIVAVLFCGITQAHYTYNNLSTASQHWTKELFELLNFLAENFVFTYIGVSTFTFRQHNWNVGFIFLAIFACIIARMVNIYPLSGLLNLGRSHKITCNMQHMLNFAGLRGAMAFSLAIRNTSSELRRMFFSTTLIIVISSVAVIGGLTTHMLQAFNIRVGVDAERQTKIKNNQAEDPNTTADMPPDSPAPTPLRSPKAFLVRIWAGFDTRYLKPLLTHSGPPLSESLPQWMRPLAEMLTTTEQLTGSGGPGTLHQRTSEGRVGEAWDLPSRGPTQDDSDLILACDEAVVGSAPEKYQQRPTTLDVSDGATNPGFSRPGGTNGGFGDAV